MTIFLDIDPPRTTAQQKGTTFRGGRLVRYDRKGTDKARKCLWAELMKHRPPEPFTGAVELAVVWVFPTTVKSKWRTWKTTRPDTDNLQKGLKDLMTKCGYWKDDALVVWESVQKRWGSPAERGLYIDIEPIT